MNGSVQTASLSLSGLGSPSVGMVPPTFRAGLGHHLTHFSISHSEVSLRRDFRYCQAGRISHHRPLPLPATLK